MGWTRIFTGVAVALLLTACSDAILKQASNGKQISPDSFLMVAEGTPDTVLGQVAIGQPLLVNSAAPVALESVDADRRCRFVRPSSRAKVAYVYTYGGGVQTPLQYIADGANAEQIQQRIALSQEFAKQASSGGLEQRALARSAANFAKGNAVEWLSRIDVLVTETEAPVYLVLTSYNPILWNIQKAPGAEIEGIIVSAYEGGAIANGVDARRTSFMGFRGSPNKDCRIDGEGAPVRADVRVAAARERNPNIDLRNYKQQWEQEYEQGMTFFRTELPRRIGKRPEWILTNGPSSGTKAILVGHVPAQPFDQQPITKLQIPSYVIPFWGSRDDAFEYFGMES